MTTFARLLALRIVPAMLLCALVTGCVRHSYSSSSARHSFPGGEFTANQGRINGEYYVSSQNLIVTDASMDASGVSLQLLVFQDLDRNGKYSAGRDRLLARDTGFRRDPTGGTLDDAAFTATPDHEPIHYRWVISTPDGKQHILESPAAG